MSNVIGIDLGTTNSCLSIMGGRDLKVVKNPALNIYNYIDDGFVKIADVRQHGPHPIYSKWSLVDQNEDFLYMEHRSWVYMIVDGQEIVKVGETGNPLGIRTSRSDQPLKGTKCRFGRLISFATNDSGDTDERIRNELFESAKEGNVSLWAKRCETVPFEEIIAGKKRTVVHSSHKDLEMAYLDHIYQETGSYPRCNMSRK
tara:strand:- start:892 stop:1494 length:603 start_codon:yes stop_codon:yes gene_type:complete